MGAWARRIQWSLSCLLLVKQRPCCLFEFKSCLIVGRRFINLLCWSFILLFFQRIAFGLLFKTAFSLYFGFWTRIIELFSIWLFKYRILCQWLLFYLYVFSRGVHLGFSHRCVISLGWKLFHATNPHECFVLKGNLCSIEIFPNLLLKRESRFSSLCYLIYRLDLNIV